MLRFGVEVVPCADEVSRLAGEVPPFTVQVLRGAVQVSGCAVRVLRRSVEVLRLTMEVRREGNAVFCGRKPRSHLGKPLWRPVSSRL